MYNSPCVLQERYYHINSINSQMENAVVLDYKVILAHGTLPSTRAERWIIAPDDACEMRHFTSILTHQSTGTAGRAERVARGAENCTASYRSPTGHTAVIPKSFHSGPASPFRRFFPLMTPWARFERSVCSMTRRYRKDDAPVTS